MMATLITQAALIMQLVNAKKKLLQEHDEGLFLWQHSFQWQADSEVLRVDVGVNVPGSGDLEFSFVTSQALQTETHMVMKICTDCFWK